MRYSVKIFLPLVCVIFCASCAATAEQSRPPENMQQLGARVLTAIRECDYKSYAEMEGVELSADDRMEFEKSCQQLQNNFGEIKDFSYLATLNSPLVINQIWRVNFKRKMVSKSNGFVEHEQLFQLLISPEKRILGIRFL